MLVDVVIVFLLAMLVDAVIIFVLAVVAGAINTMVGGGTYIMLPVLHLLVGLPAQIANATNRVAVSVQAAAASVTFRKHGVGALRTSLWPASVALLGGIVGAHVNLELDEDSFRSVMGWILLVGVALFFIKKPAQKKDGEAESGSARPPLAGLLGAFVLGAYGGFLGAGVGVMIMILLPPLMRLDLVHMVAVKVLMVLALSISSSVVYIWRGMIDWTAAVPLFAGYALGAVLGARLTVLGGNRWTRRVVAVVSVVLAVLLILGIKPAGS